MWRFSPCESFLILCGRSSVYKYTLLLLGSIQDQPARSNQLPKSGYAPLERYTHHQKQVWKHRTNPQMKVRNLSISTYITCTGSRHTTAVFILAPDLHTDLSEFEIFDSWVHSWVKKGNVEVVKIRLMGRLSSTPSILVHFLPLFCLYLHGWLLHFWWAQANGSFYVPPGHPWLRDQWTHRHQYAIYQVVVKHTLPHQQSFAQVPCLWLATQPHIDAGQFPLQLCQMAAWHDSCRTAGGVETD